MARTLKRRRTKSRKLDVTNLREALRDRRQWCAVGVVTKPDGESSHYELVTEDGNLVDILVDVETRPEGVDLTCRLAGGAGSQGMWTIPAEGDEVIIMIPSGRIDFMPVIVGMMSTYAIDNPSGQGPDPSRTVIVNGEVLVHDGTGSAVSLALKSDVQSVVDDYNGFVTTFNTHTHTTGVGPSGPPSATETSTSNPDGTTILKAK